MISYAILVCNEHVELERLLAHLLVNFDKTDEVVILKDSSKSSHEIDKVIKKYEQLFNKRLFSYERALNKDFAAQKNFLTECCANLWIFNIDADEIPSSVLMTSLHGILEENKDFDAMQVPRVNIVKGITKDHIKKWNWFADEKGYINFPDWQMRLYRNSSDIRWVGSVHEKLTGFKKYGFLPADDNFSLLHIKEIKKQEEQNEFYSQIN